MRRGFCIVALERMSSTSAARHRAHGPRAYHQMEIRFGRFATAVMLPGPVEAEAAEAEYKNGFLTVLLPKPKPKQTKVE
jgi:HSP20 family molecular chaperone IbpA